MIGKNSLGKGFTRTGTRVLCLSCLLLCLLYIVAHPLCKSNDRFVFIPKQSNEPILNPGCGLTFPNYRNDQETGPILKKWVNIAYKRFLWSELEPEEGKYRFDILTNWIHRWRSKGFRVAFGVVSTSVRNRGKKPVQATPIWLFHKGVSGVSHLSGRQIDPVYWDSLYLDRLVEFVSNMGKALQGGKGVEFVDMRGIGVFGEMHFGKNIKGMWTNNQLNLHGFSAEKYFSAYKRMIDVYKSAFKRTSLFLNIAPGRKRASKLVRFNVSWITPGRDRIVEYCVKQGVGLRYDGLSLNHYMSMKVISSYFREYGYPQGDERKGVKCIYEFAKSEKDYNQLRRLIQLALEDPISYLNLNFVGDLGGVNKKVKAIIRKTALKIGYRFALLRVTCPSQVSVPLSGKTNLALELLWVNLGNAPCYSNYMLSLILQNRSGKIVAVTRKVPDIPFWKWIPRKRIKVKVFLPIPANIEKGSYLLKVSVSGSEGESFIKLPLTGDDGEHRYILFRIIVKNDPNRRRILVPII